MERLELVHWLTFPFPNGSNQFQREYIEYLQERNSELMGRLNHMKETYENQILSKDFNKHYLLSTLEDVSNICTQIPQEIDLFFDKMTAAMGVLKNILLRKSEMVQLVEKISKAINTSENCRADFTPMDGSSLLKEPISETRSVKTGTVKVSPMINGHIISTEPRIYLSRVPEIFTPTRRNETHKLSPIIEASPEIPSDSSRKERNSLREITIPVERLNLNKLSFNYMSEESPRSRFKGPKTWKKSLSSGALQSNNQRNQVFLENKENLSKDIALGGLENVDPLEGPSWLHNDSEMNSSTGRFMDYRRRKHRYATVFDKNEEFVSYGGRMTTLSQEKEKETNDENSDDTVDDRDDGDDNGNEGGDVLSQSREENYRQRDFEEFKERISDGSVDLFCESYSSEFEENVSPSCKTISERKEANGDSLADKSKVSKPENDFKIETPPFCMNTNENKTCSPSRRLKSCKNENENFSDIRRSKYKKKSQSRRAARSTFDRTTSGASLDKSSHKSENGEKSRNSADRGGGRGEKNSKPWSAVNKEAFVKLEDFVLKKEFVGEKLSLGKTGSPSAAGSPVVSLLENEGRKRRKAAPTVLVEPTLKTKLRRN